MPRIPSQGRLLSSHSQNSVLFSNHDQQQYDFDVPQSNPQTNHVIFNQSFYKQKQLISQQAPKQFNNQKKKQLFLSIQYIKKYFQNHSIQPIVSKNFKNILDTDYLPQNPYNMLFRLLLPDSLLLNSIHFYNVQKIQNTKKINSNIKSLANQGKKITKNINTSSSHIDSWTQQILTKRVQISDKQFYIGSKIARYVHPNALYIIWTQIASKSRLNSINALINKHNLSSYFLSIGGPALLLLQGVSTYAQINQTVKLSLKVNQPLALSSYTTEYMLQLAYYLISTSNQQPSLILANFCNFVIEQALQQMQNNLNQVYMFLTKLSVTVAEKQSIVEWSTSQLIHEKGKIVKEIVKLLITDRCELRTFYYVKSNKRITNNLFEDYFTLTKTYVFITPTNESQIMNSTKKSSKSTQSSIIVYTPTPLSFVFQHFFIVPQYYEYLDKAFGLNSIKNEVIFGEYKKQKYKKTIQDIKLHLLASASWNLFYISLYDFSLSSISYQNIVQGLNLLINNPLNFLSQIIHQLKLCKTILNPTASSLTTNSQTHLYQILQQISALIYQYQKQCDHPYPQIFITFETLRKLINIILTKQKFKANIIKLLLDYGILCLRGAINSYNAISWAVTGTLQQYVIELDKTLGNQNSKFIISQNITYNYYLQNLKILPLNTLYLPDEIKRYKQQLGTTQTQTRQLIYAKYLQQNQLYQVVYRFYWKIIQGKKLQYPLTQLTELIKSMALKRQIQSIEIQRTRLNKININNRTRGGQGKITLNRVSGIQIYQMSKGINNQFTSYSYTKDSLNQSALTQYRKFYNKFNIYFQDPLQNIPNLNGKTKYILSLKSLPYLNQFSQQASGIYIVTLNADLIIKKHLKKQQLISVIHNQLTQFMEKTDHDQLGVLGIYASWRNLGNSSIVYHGDSDQIYAQTSFQSNSIIKFDYKRKLPFDQFYKFLQHCISTNKQIQVRLIYKDQKIIQSCNVNFNFYFYQGQQSTNYLQNSEKNVDLLQSLIKNAGWEQRIFYSSKDIVQWGIINKVANKISQQIKISKQPTSLQTLSPTKSKPLSQNFVGSMKKIKLEQQFLIEELLLEEDDGLYSPSTTPQVLRNISPSYSNLQQSHHQLLTLLYLLTYIKNDRRNRFQLKFLMDQVSLTQYYLMEHCLKSDKFIFLQGLVVEIGNLLAAVKGYLKQREDNLGTEWEILWVEKVVCRITGLVKMLMVNVTAQVKKYGLFKY